MNPHLTIAVSGLHAGENPQPGVGVIRSLRRTDCEHAAGRLTAGRLTIVGLAYNVMESGVFADGCADVVYHMPRPSAGRDALLERFDELLEQQPIDIFIPTLDAELPNLLHLEDRLAARGVKLMLPARESHEACRKASLARLAERCDVRVPESIGVLDADRLPKAAEELGYPLMVKGPFYGAYRVGSEAALRERFHELIADWGGPVILQECVRGGEFCVMGLGDGTGAMPVSCAVRKTIVSEKGKGFGAVTVRDERLSDICERIVAELRWNGPLELEFLYDESADEFCLIEINPRFPAWVDFPSNFGLNLPRLLVERLTTGRLPPQPQPEPGRFFIRHCIEVVGEMRDLGEFATSGQVRCGSRQDSPQPADRQSPGNPVAQQLPNLGTLPNSATGATL